LERKRVLIVQEQVPYELAVREIGKAAENERTRSGGQGEYEQASLPGQKSQDYKGCRRRGDLGLLGKDGEHE
jgi:hypothetical protein